MKASDLDVDALKKGMNGIDWNNKCDVKSVREKKNEALKVGDHD